MYLKFFSIISLSVALKLGDILSMKIVSWTISSTSSFSSSDKCVKLLVFSCKHRYRTKSSTCLVIVLEDEFTSVNVSTVIGLTPLDIADSHC